MPHSPISPFPFKTLPTPHSFNEPHYRNYIACDLGALFSAAGFECGSKWIASATKTLSFYKPLAPSASELMASATPLAASGNPSDN